jgi:hypothetical protein
MYRPFRSLTALMIVIAGAACAVRVKPPAAATAPSAPGATLWEKPDDLARQDLFNGPWGPQRAPEADAEYRLVERKHTGVNPGMTVRDPHGQEWSVKQMPPGGLDREGSVEVAVSRLLSAIGYHQPPVYYLPAFRLKDDWGVRTELGGRFRLKDESLDDVGPWSWQENPFIGSEPYEGLLVVLMMLNSTDLKNSNNTLYERRTGGRVEQWYVVRDVGAALGDANRIAPLKGDPDAFEREPFILGVSGGFVNFAYGAWYRSLVRDRIKPSDVRWASTLLGGLSDRQMNDAFRAGGFDPSETGRFVRKLREKTQQGRELR